MDDVPITDIALTFYVITNWLLLAISLGLLVRIYRSSRYLYVKPSILLLTFSHILYQWPLALYATYIEVTIPEPWSIACLVHGFIVLGLLIAPRILRRNASELWERVIGEKATREGGSAFSLLALAVFVVLLAALYLSYVSFSKTGLYALFTDPIRSDFVREESMKLLEDPIPRYAFSIMVATFAPILGVMLVLLGLRGLKKRDPFVAIFSLVAFTILMSVVSLSGARGFAVNLILAIVVAILFSKGLPFRPVRFIAALAVILLPAVFITLVREEADINGENLVLYLEGVIYRAFVVPFEAGTWYVDYVQSTGRYFGIAGIPKLASLFGVESILVSNVIGLEYIPFRFASVSGTAGYLFTYYSYFGLLSLPISLFFLISTDLALLPLKKVNEDLILPVFSALVIAILAFTQSDFTTVLVTQGFIPTLFTGLALSLPGRRRYSSRLMSVRGCRA